jgi:hypothetical protein
LRQERLVFFCSDIDTDLDSVRDGLVDLFETANLTGAELKRVGAPESLSEAGWMALTVKVTRGGRTAAAAALGPHLVDATRTIAKALREEAFGVYVDAAGAARAVLHGAGGFPRVCEGETFHVIRQLASWIETDPDQLFRYFSAYAQRNEIVGPVDLSDVEVPPDVPRDSDEEDRFVEAKLKHARELMDRYRRK